MQKRYNTEDIKTTTKPSRIALLAESEKGLDPVDPCLRVLPRPVMMGGAQCSRLTNASFYANEGRERMLLAALKNNSENGGVQNDTEAAFKREFDRIYFRRILTLPFGFALLFRSSQLQS